MDAIIEMHHGLKIRVENARVYRERAENKVANASYKIGERLIISNGSANFIIFKGSDRSVLISPRLFKRVVPVKFVLA